MHKILKMPMFFEKKGLFGRTFLQSLALFCVMFHGLLVAEKAHGTQGLSVQQVTLEHNVPVYFVEDHSLPVLSIVFSLHGGTLHDPKDLPLLSGAVAELLLEGTQTYEKDALKNTLMDLGIQLGFPSTPSLLSGGYNDMMGFTLRVPTQVLDKALDLLRSVLTQPLFDEKDLSLWRGRTWASFLNLAKNPKFLATIQLRKLLYGGTPWATSYLDTLSQESLGRITPKDLHDHWGRLMTLDRLKIGVCGDIDAQTLRKKLQGLLAGFPQSSTLKTPSLPDYPRDFQRKHVPTKHPQGLAVITHPGLVWKDKEYGAYELMIHLLGGGMTSRLFLELRERLGLVYNVSAQSTERKEMGKLVFQLATQNATMDQAIEALKQQILLLKNKGIDQKELDQAKEALLGRHTLGHTSSLSIASTLSGALAVDAPRTFDADYIQTIRSVTLKDFNAFVKRFLTPERFQMVTVGNQEKPNPSPMTKDS